MPDFIARQPILDAKLRTVAYEFLFRAGIENIFVSADNDKASLSTMSSLLDDDDLDRLSSGKTVFINFTRDLLLHDYGPLLPKNRVVIEIVEDAWADETLVPCCSRLKEAGYKLALDDVFDVDACERFKDVADIVKVDFLLAEGKARAQIADYALSRGMVLLAEKVETHQAWQEATQLGYTLFQGYYFSKPKMVLGKGAKAQKSTDIRLLKEISHSDFNMQRIEKIIKHDPVLSLKLLKYINSAAFNLSSTVRSIQHALVMLGENTLRKLALVWIYSGYGKSNPTLFNQAATRGMFCEQLAPLFNVADNAGEIFMMGLFSLVDAILDQPLIKILESINLSPEVERALIGHEGPYSAILDLVKGYERGDWDRISEITNTYQIDENELPSYYMEAVIWAQTISGDTLTDPDCQGGL